MSLKHIIIISLFVLSLGCTGDTSVPEIYTGTNGVLMSFIKETPPPEVYEEDRFLVGLNIKNDGPTDVRNGRISLGIEEDFMNVVGWNQEAYDIGLEQIDYYTYSFSQNGKTIDDPIAREAVALISLQTKELPGQTEVHTSLITATVCYDYKTILNEEVCIEADLFNTQHGVKVCDSEEKSLTSQGGPVAITRITPTMHPGSDGSTVIPQFRLEVRNMGIGTVISSGAQESCSSSGIDKMDVNEIKIKAKLFSRTLLCSPTSFRLDEQKTAKVSCELTGGVEAVPDAYMSMLVVELDYGYTTSISKEIKIQKEWN